MSSASLLQPVLLLHVYAATIGLVAGFGALALRKGSRLHAASGRAFFVTMIIASLTGATIALFLKPNAGNTMVSVLTLYLVCTAWVAARRREAKPGFFDFAALLFIVASGAASGICGYRMVASGTASSGGYPPLFFFLFAAIALLLAGFDVRMITRGGDARPKRIARHLTRMSLTLLIATVSAQGRAFPEWLRDSPFVHLPALLVIGVMLYWWYRVSFRKRIPPGKPRIDVPVPRPAAVP
jgi:uncharacterized membrane protein